MRKLRQLHRLAFIRGVLAANFVLFSSFGYLNSSPSWLEDSDEIGFFADASQDVIKTCIAEFSKFENDYTEPVVIVLIHKYNNVYAQLKKPKVTSLIRIDSHWARGPPLV